MRSKPISVRYRGERSTEFTECPPKATCQVPASQPGMAAARTPKAPERGKAGKRPAWWIWEGVQAVQDPGKGHGRKFDSEPCRSAGAKIPDAHDHAARDQSRCSRPDARRVFPGENGSAERTAAAAGLAGVGGRGGLAL